MSLAKSALNKFTSSSSVTAIKLPASEISTSSSISFSKPSPLITVTDFKLAAKNSDLFFLDRKC